MANNFDISPLNPLKFYVLSDVLPEFGGNITYNSFDTNLNYRAFDADFFYRNIKSWEERRFYAQPYQQGDMVNIQFLGIDNIPSGVYAGNPYTAYLIDCDNKIVNSYSVTTSALALIDNQRIRECFIPLYNIDEGYYRVVIRRRQINVANEFKYVISEPIHVKEVHENSVLIKYKNSKNTQGVIFESDIEFQFRTYGVVNDLTTESKFTTYEDEPLNLTMLSGTPYRTWLFQIGGDGNQVPQWIGDKLERITLCDSLLIDSVYYTRNEGAKLEANKKANTVLSTYQIVLRERYNDNSLYQIDYQTPVIMNAIVDNTKYIYVESIKYSANTISVNLIFKGVNRIMAYLNGYFKHTRGIKGIFAIDANNNIVFIASSSAELASYPDIRLHNVYWYGFQIKTEVRNGETNFQLLVNGTNMNYAIRTGETGAVTTATVNAPTNITVSLADNQNHTMYVVFEGMTEISYTGDTNVVEVRGDIPPSCEVFDFQSQNIRYVGNLYDHATSLLANVSLNDNKLSSANIDRIIKSMVGRDYFVNITAEYSSQTPLAPPSDQVRDVILSKLIGLGNDIVVD